MAILSSFAAQAAYLAGRHDEALDRATRVLARDPNAVEAHLTTALVMLRRAAVTETLEALRRCLAQRPAEWVFERLVQDSVAVGPPGLTTEMAFGLGALLRARLDVLRPALPVEQRRAEHEFINVVGTSYVRSFGGSPAFFPLFIGMGPGMLLLTEPEATVTRRKFKENTARLDPRRNTMLVVGSDPYYHVIGLEKAGAQRPNGATEDDLALMDRVAERHGPILDDAKATFSGALMLLCATPTQNEVMNTLCRRVNERLQALCAEKGVMFLDWWDELADPVTGRLKDAYCANAYPGDIHFTLEATQRFMELLKVAGQFSAAVEPSCAYDWSHVFECSVDAGEKTRIWCEPKVTPNNAFKSHKIASAHLGGRVADLMVALSAGRRENTMLMVNVRDGFLPVTIPAQAGTGTVAFTETEADFQTAQMTLDFYGRTDVALMRSGVLPTYDARGVSQAVLQIHPDTVDADIERCNQAIARLGPVPILVGTPFPDRIGALNLGSRKINTFQVSNRHIPEEWRNYAVVLAR